MPKSQKSLQKGNESARPDVGEADREFSVEEVALSGSLIRGNLSQFHESELRKIVISLSQVGICYPEVGLIPPLSYHKRKRKWLLSRLRRGSHRLERTG